MEVWKDYPLVALLFFSLVEVILQQICWNASNPLSCQAALPLCLWEGLLRSLDPGAGLYRPELRLDLQFSYWRTHFCCGQKVSGGSAAGRSGQSKSVLLVGFGFHPQPLADGLLDFNACHQIVLLCGPYNSCSVEEFWGRSNWRCSTTQLGSTSGRIWHGALVWRCLLIYGLVAACWVNQSLTIVWQEGYRLTPVKSSSLRTNSPVTLEPNGFTQTFKAHLFDCIHGMYLIITRLFIMHLNFVI